MNNTEFLRKVKVFQDLTDREIQEIADIGNEQIFREGDFLFQEKDPSNGFFLIVSGVVDVMKGQSSRLARLREGEIVGELSLFDAWPRSASAVGRIYPEIRVLFFSKDRFLNLLQVNRELGYKVLTAFLRKTCERLRMADEELRGLAGNLYYSGNSRFGE